jgi:hypothetical protein
MKNKIKISVVTFLLAISSFYSCNEELLTINPVNSVDANTVFSTTASANAAMNGIYRAMTRRYLGSQGHSGYPAFMLIIDMMGDDMVLSTTSNGWHRSEQQWISHRNETFTMAAFPFDLFYRLISNANNIINNIDNAEGSVADKNRIKGEALGIRALSYFSLVQCYGERYNATKKPNTQIGVSMPLISDFEALERLSVEDVYTQINKDLTDAAAIIGSSRINKSHINVNIVKGIHARVALAQQDWTNAARLALEARQGATLMSNAQYEDGFADITNPEWMWGFDHLEDQTEFFGGYHSYISCNYNSSVIRTCPRALNSVVYAGIPATDVRSKMWAPAPTATNSIAPPGGVRRPFMGQKFRLPGVPSTSTMGDTPYLRAGELFLIEAEARARLDQFTQAQDILFTLVKNRNPLYVKTTNTGAALITEIIFNRRIELWGEGHRWFDLKRLNLGMDRRGANHISANILIDQALPNAIEWQFLIPRREIDTNPKTVQNPL